MLSISAMSAHFELHYEYGVIFVEWLDHWGDVRAQWLLPRMQSRPHSWKMSVKKKQFVQVLNIKVFKLNKFSNKKKNLNESCIMNRCGTDVPKRSVRSSLYSHSGQRIWQCHIMTHKWCIGHSMIKLSCTKQVHVFVCAGNQVYQSLHDKVLLCMCWVMCKIIEIQKKNLWWSTKLWKFHGPIFTTFAKRTIFAVCAWVK